MAVPSHRAFRKSLSMTTLEPEKLAHELSVRGLDWADKDSAYKALDDATKSILSECIASLNEELSATAAETKARRSPKFMEHLSDKAHARKECNRSRVNYDTYKAFVELVRSREATERALASLV